MSAAAVIPYAIAAVICAGLGWWLHRTVRKSPGTRVESIAIACGGCWVALVVASNWAGAV